MLLLIAVLLSAAPAAQVLEDEAGALLAENRFEAALGKFEAANRIESTPERLLSIARCHHELAYARVHEAARMQPTEPVIRELARSLDELEADRGATPLPEAPAAPHHTVSPAPILTQTQLAPASGHKTLAVAAGIGALAMFTAAGLMHMHAVDLTQRLSDPNEVDKAGVYQSSKDWQTGSTLLVGAGIVLAASGFLAWRF